MLNTCQFIGNLAADPEIRRTQDGKQIGSFRMGCTEKWRSKDGDQKERTEWVNVVCFNEGLNKVIEQYLKKGSKVYVSGKMQTRKWQDQNGNDRYSTEIVMQLFDSKLVMLDGRKDGDYSAPPATGNQYAKESQGGLPDLSDSIPFAMEWRG